MIAPRRGKTLTTLMAGLIGLGLTGAPAVPASPPSQLAIEVLSNRADLISGGDALVEVSLPDGAKAEELRADVDGRDVSGAFAIRGNARVMGVLEDLAPGENMLTVSAPGRGRKATVTITNHPIGGPIFAGPQVRPWFCSTAEHGLGPAQDEQCNAPTAVSYLYKSSTTGGFESYDKDHPPADVATITTDQGHTVPYIVQVETGTMDRGIYKVAVLADPNQPWEPWAPQPAWNHKLMIPFGGSCAAHHKQTAPEGGSSFSVLDDQALSRGFAVAASGLNTLGYNCNEVVSAEALMMLKEHLTESYGPIRYTIGKGFSGGSIQQYNIAASYPGLLDGIAPDSTFPDIASTTVEVFDCGLLVNYFTTKSPHLWAVAAQRGFVEGHANVGSACLVWTAAFLPVLDPQGRGPFGAPVVSPGTDCGMPREQVYQPETNPGGVRCDVFGYQIALYGARTGDGFANRPLDNVGVQYGLDALNSELITPEQFVDLNAKIGGYDIDLNPQPQRTEADPAALSTAYRAGRVTDARQLATVPIIDLRGQSNSEIHSSFNSYTLRARLTEANGTHANQAIWTGAITLAGDTTFLNCGSGTTNGVINSPSECPANSALRVMDDWLAKIEADASATPLADKVIRSKPAAATDSCWIAGRQVTDTNACRAAFPYFANPRMAAGGPLTNDILKCRLKPLDRADYSIEFSDEQWAALQEAFPAGVCDWRKPGVDQQPSQPWLTFADGPGGRPLGERPVSTLLRPGGKYRP